MKHKLLALLCAAALAFGLAGCVLSTPDTVGSIGNVEISSGLYLLAQYNAYQSAAKLASSDQDSTNVKSFLKETITTDADSGETFVKSGSELLDGMTVIIAGKRISRLLTYKAL